MIKKSDILNLAISEIGYLEKGSNKNLDSKTGNAGKKNFTKYWRDICPGMNGSAWCQCFINWLFDRIGGTEEAQKILCCEDKGYTFYTPDAVSRAKKAGMWKSGTAGIQPGDIVYFYGYVSSEGRSRVHHVGIVEKVDDKYIYTIEGNTASGKGVIDNGGQVARKTYNIGYNELYGYFRPEYTKEEAESTNYEKVGWHIDINGWWYRHTEGFGPATYYHGGIFIINELPYAFDEDGYLIYNIEKLAIHPGVGAIYVR